MYVERMTLKNFRNYTHADLTFHERVNIIIGDNAQGKTNLVEALYTLGFGKSFRTSQDKELIKLDTDFTHVSGNIYQKNRKVQIDYKYNIQQKKEIKVNDLPLKKLGDLLGTLNVVIFSPEDLQLVKGSPNLRRKFMDKSISQMHPNYYHLLVEYNKIMKQRNNLLKSNNAKAPSEVMMSIWDEQLASVGSKIMIYRLKFLNSLKSTAHKIHSEISHHTESLEIIYQSNYLPKNLEDEDLYDKIYNGILWLLKDKISIDYKRGYTSVGPHRDDLSFYINSNESRKFASQGQVRTVALSLKLSEISIIKDSLDESPILILDDVLSELDPIRQNQLVQYISELQTFITTTEINSLLYERISDAKMIQIKNGSITEGVYSGGENGRN